MKVVSLKQIEIHQIEGLDDRRRGFNRHVDVQRTENGYLASFEYEGVTTTTAPHPTIKESMGDLVAILQKKGFKTLRSRLNFRGRRYLAEREPWTTHPDPV
jgi:hypothetical protein